MDAIAPIIKAVVATLVPFAVTALVALAAKYDIVIDADALSVFLSGLVASVLTGIGVYAAPANKPKEA